MNERAWTIAKTFQHEWKKAVAQGQIPGDAVHIYMDALVVWFRCDTDAHLALQKVYREYPRMEEAKLDEFSVFLVPFDVGEIDPEQLPIDFKLAQSGYIDHRTDVFGCLDDLLEWCKAVLEGPVADDTVIEA